MKTPQDGGKVVSLTHRPPLPPGNAPGTHFCWRLSRPQGHSAIGRIIITISQGRERECKVRGCELEEALNRMKIVYWIKNTIHVFRKIENISARKFEPITYSSHVPHTSRTAGCKQAVSGISCHNI